MKYDFLNRVDAQRMILENVNSYHWSDEPLMSLSKKSIERWTERNVHTPPSELISLLLLASEKLFFLANKSQEQITEDYKRLSIEIYNVSNKIKEIINLI